MSNWVNYLIPYNDRQRNRINNIFLKAWSMNKKEVRIRATTAGSTFETIMNRYIVYNNSPFDENELDHLSKFFIYLNSSS